MNEKTFTFHASLPPIQSAIKRSGNGDGKRIQLDIPESDVLSAALIDYCCQKPLKVTVEILDE